MRTSEILRSAARIVGTAHLWGEPFCCCPAILRHEWEGLGLATPAMNVFKRFKPKHGSRMGDPWWPDFSKKSQSERVLALLFAAAIAESEGD